MAQVTITQLPQASALTGAESVPIVQNGVTVQTTASAISGAGALNYPFLTVGLTAGLAQSRYISTNSGLTITDNGAQGTLVVNLIGAALSLNSSATGIQVKTGSNTVTARQIAVNTGLTITNGDGVSGDPTIGLGTLLSSFAALTGTGILAMQAGIPAKISILGNSNQITILNGNGATDVTVGLADNPIIPGIASVTVPIGATGSRPASAVNGMLRYNTTTAVFEGYANNAWGSITTGTGVTSVATGTGLTGGPITSTGTISIDVTGVTAATYGSSSVVPVIAVNAQGQITSATNTTINAVTLTTGTISTTPSNSTDIANKAYVDTVAQGLDTKDSVVAGTTANITLSGVQTIDGIAVVATDRVLVKNQTAPAENGIYVASATAWSRAPDMSTWAQVPGAYVFVETGSTLADTGWVCTSNAGGTINVTAITWAQFSGAGSGVSSITFGSTGLTPSTATTGAVTVAGTLAVANGGTGATNATDARTNLVAAKSGTNSDITELYALNGTSYGVAYQNLTNQLVMGSVLTFDGTTLTAPSGAFSTISASGVITSTIVTGTAPFTVASTTTVTNLGATNTVNTAITANSTNATNYLTFVSTTSGNLPQLVNSSITCNPSTGQLTGGIAGGAF